MPTPLSSQSAHAENFHHYHYSTIVGLEYYHGILFVAATNQNLSSSSPYPATISFVAATRSLPSLCIDRITKWHHPYRRWHIIHTTSSVDWAAIDDDV
jgi:hypothetical protein